MYRASGTAGTVHERNGRSEWNEWNRRISPPHAHTLTGLVTGFLNALHLQVFQCFFHP